MVFPDYKLASYQMQTGHQTRFAMGGSAPAAMSLRQLLSLASDEEMTMWDEFSLGYTPSQGSADLREVIAEMYPGLSAENILVTAGALEAITIAYHAVLNSADRFQVVTPVFEPLAIVAEAIGASVIKVPMSKLSGQWQMDMDSWIDQLLPKTRMVTINFPHNPTGAMISRLQQQSIIDHCRDFGCWLFSDEVFRGLEQNPEDRLPAVASVYEKGISLGVMSKAFGLGGLRVGWIACQDKTVLAKMREIKSFLSICNGRADEILSLIAIRHADEIQHINHTLLSDNLALIKKSISPLAENIQWYPPQAGCVAFPEVISGYDDGRGLAESLLQGTGVNVVPGDCFLQGEKHFRVGFGQRDFPQAWPLFEQELLRSL